MVSIDLFYFLYVSSCLYVLGLFGILINRRSVIHILMAIELILLAVNLNFLFFSVYLDDIKGQLFGLFILTVAAAESSVGLAILVAYFRVKNTISMNSMNLLQGLLFLGV